MSSQNSIHFQKEIIHRSVRDFLHHLFCSRVRWISSHDQEVTYLFFEDWITSSTIAYTLPILAEVIYFDDLVLLTLPKGSGYFSLDYRVVLQLPDPVHGGKPGSEIAGGDPDARYGKVYFDGITVGVQSLGGKKGLLGCGIP